MSLENVTGSFGPAANADDVIASPASVPKAAVHSPFRPCITPPEPDAGTRDAGMSAQYARDRLPGQLWG